MIRLKMKYFDTKGQALVSLLFFMIIAGTITASAVGIVMVNSLSSSKLELSDAAYAVAESGVENAILRLLRDPSYSGEIFTVNGDVANVQVASSSGNMYTITSLGTSNKFSKKLKVDLVYTTTMQVTSWKEIY